MHSITREEKLQWKSTSLAKSRAKHLSLTGHRSGVYPTVSRDEHLTSENLILQQICQERSHYFLNRKFWLWLGCKSLVMMLTA